MLIHGMGHISHGDEGAYLHEVNSSPNTQDTDAKAAETAADLYARGLLLENSRRDGKRAEVAQAIINNIKVLSYNVYLAATLSQSLPEILCLTPALYWDMGYSHPNLVFRLMETVNQLAPLQETERKISKTQS